MFKKYIKARSSIYGQVVYVITLLSIFLFLSFGILFRSVNEQYMKSVIQQFATRIGKLIEGSLYYSMLENDKSDLKRTLNIIRDMPGIDDIHMYDKRDSLVYSSGLDILNENINEDQCNPNCISCHTDIEEIFSRKEKVYRVIRQNCDCGMVKNHCAHRHLVIISPILNEETCSNNACHVHDPTEEFLGSLVIKIPLKSLDESLSKSTTEFYIMATVMTILLLVYLIFFTRRKIKRPLVDIMKASEAVAGGDTSTRLDESPDQLDDIKMVSRAFNHMLDNLSTATGELHVWSQQLEYKVQKKTEELKEAHNELIHVERMASLGKLSSSVAHEINNPLAGVLTYTKLVHKQLTKMECKDTKKESMLKHLKMIEMETKRCGDIVKGLLDFSRKDQQDFEHKSLHIILRETYNLMVHPMKIANINFVKDFEAEFDLVKCSPNQLKQACIAILVNASEAIRENGEIIIKTINPDEDSVTFMIIDNGLGIPPEDIPHIFEPFFSKKQEVSGIGLGLAVVHGIIQSHGGKIDVKSTPRKGTSISITLPLVRD